MEKEQVQAILSALKANYPNHFLNWTAKQSKDYLALWYDAFKDDPYELVASAVKSIMYTDTRDFAPNIGQVRAKMIELSNVNSIDAQEAWTLLKGAMRHSTEDAIRGYRSLPEEVQDFLGSEERGVAQLKEWAVMDLETLNTVVHSNFVKNWNVRAKHNREVKALPSSVQREIALLTEGKLLK